MLTFLLVLHALITATLVGVILMQRSEGGGLGMGGSPSGLMSARGAADFLTRATTILASAFVLLSIASAVVASRTAAPRKFDTSLAKPITPTPAAPAPAVPMNGDPLAATGGAPTLAPQPTTSAVVPTASAPAAVATGTAPRPATKPPVQEARTPAVARPTARPAPRDPMATPPLPAAPIATPARDPAPAAPTATPPVAPTANNSN